MPPPPPPPPPMCLPFSKSKGDKRISWNQSLTSSVHNGALARSPSVASERTLTSIAGQTNTNTNYTGANTHVGNLTFKSDSEKYSEVPGSIAVVMREGEGKKPTLVRGNTMTGTKKSTASGKGWGYGWGLGKKKEVKQDTLDRINEKESSSIADPVPKYSSMPTRSNTRASRDSDRSRRTVDTAATPPPLTRETSFAKQPKLSPFRRPSQDSARSGQTSGGADLSRNNSTSTLVGSALSRKMADSDSIKPKEDTTERLEDLRKLMMKDMLDYYVVPSEDAHQSEITAASDRRREWISGFTGSAGQAVISKSAAYLITDSRYWIQAEKELDPNWTVIMAGSADGPRDWIDWLVDRIQTSRIGIDARMISHEKASLINSKLQATGSKMVYPPQNLVDLAWTSKPGRSREMVYLQPIEYTGKDAHAKISLVRDWIKKQPPDVPSYRTSPPTASQIHVATLMSSLPCIAYILNLRGADIPYNPLFHSYLFISLTSPSSLLFIDSQKLTPQITEYLRSIHVEVREYNDLWTWLRKHEWGEGKILISPETSYAISLMLTRYRYSVMPNVVEEMKSVKNEVEIEGMRRAYLRDGVSFTRFMAWLDDKLAQGYEVTEYEAAFRLTEFRKKNKNFVGLAYQNISATGPNAALPHYTPRKATAAFISRDTPYVNDSGGQYRDGTCDTTRTMHFGRATPDQSEAYTRVLQGHIAIDSAIFPEGTSGHQLDVLARKALWREGLNYMHGTGHGVGSFLTVHEGPQSFSSQAVLKAGHVLTNEPGFYKAGHWGIRIESALVVRRVKTRHQFNGHIWLGFERLTCVPIQTKMIKESMLTKEEKAWIKEHNQRCYDKLAPYLKEDKRALKWLKREAERGIGVVDGPGGMRIDWD